MRVPKIVVAQMHAAFRSDDSLVVVERHRTQGPADIVRAARRTGEVCTMTQRLGSSEDRDHERRLGSKRRRWMVG